VPYNRHAVGGGEAIIWHEESQKTRLRARVDADGVSVVDAGGGRGRRLERGWNEGAAGWRIPRCLRI